MTFYTITKGSQETLETLLFTMEAASRFELENNGFAGRFRHYTLFYLTLPNHTKYISIKALQYILITLTYSENTVYLFRGVDIEVDKNYHENRSNELIYIKRLLI